MTRKSRKAVLAGIKASTDRFLENVSNLCTVVRSTDIPPVAPAPQKDVLKTMFATQTWLVTWQRQNGVIQTNAVLICGVWHLADIEEQARDALHRQHDISDAHILRLSLDFNMTPARLEALQEITTSYQQRLRFEAECG